MGDSMNIIFNVLSVSGVEAMVATSALQFNIPFLSEGARGRGAFLIMVMELSSSAVTFALFTTYYQRERTGGQMPSNSEI